MKAALIAALVAALVSAAAATATTSGLITGKQIKNGSIGTVDLSAKAKRALRGERGPRGFTGAQGVPGATGATGVSGAAGAPGGFDPTKLQYIEGPDVTVPSGEVGTAIASCPAGTTAISGGFYASISNVAASQTYGPSFHGVIVSNDSSISLTINATVVCAAR
jgi:hypothetical protein